ncbi:MAG: ATP-dependent DNA helicase [Desulfurococcaceae archaeon]|nr:ATP-dependent DNA helicase [Desulfurococcaceae archaeon]
MKGNCVAIVKAPTGFGKTVTVLYSISKMLRRGVFERVMYTVRTRNELDPVIKECKSLDLDFVVVYSIKRMCPLARDSNISSEGFWSICAVLRLRGECRFYSGVSTVSSYDVVKIVKDSEDHLSIAKNLADRIGVCPYYTLIRFVNDVDVAILTYPYIFKESIWLATFRDYDASQTLLVIDEAHNILNIGSIMGETISIKDLKKAIDESLDLSAEDVAERLKNILYISINNVSGKGYTYIGKEKLGVDTGFVDKVSNLVFTAIVKAMKNFEYKYNIAKLDIALSRVSKFLSLLVNPNYDVYTSKDFYNQLVLSVLLTNFIPLEKIFEKFSAAILMSATPPSAEFLKNAIKIDKHVLQVDVEDFGAHNYLKENSVTVIFTGATTSYRSRNKAVFNIYKELIVRVYEVVPRGIILVVYPSYDVMNTIAEELAIENAIVESGHTPLDVLNFVIHKPKVLLNIVAGGRLAEGIEFVVNGKSLVESVIVVGIPYPQPDDYVEKLRQSIVKGGGSYVDYYRDIAAVRVLQAIGRAIRNENDYAFVILADRRYVNPEILKRLGLRPRVITNNISKIIQVANNYFNQIGM